jgi:inosose dehydratase
MGRKSEAIAAMGIKYADLTDSHEGGMLGVEYGSVASVSLDSHPAQICQRYE